MKEDDKYNAIIKEINNKKFKKWYKLKDLVELKNISYKSLKNMVQKIYKTYNPKGLIHKRGRRYYISYRILDKFELKQPRKNKRKTWYSHDWKTNISYSTKDYYNISYHKEVINIIKNLSPTINYLSIIEEDKSGRLHVHMIADETKDKIKPIVKSVLATLLDKDYSLYCENIILRGSSVDYLIKNPQIII